MDGAQKREAHVPPHMLPLLGAETAAVCDNDQKESPHAAIAHLRSRIGTQSLQRDTCQLTKNSHHSAFHPPLQSAQIDHLADWPLTRTQ